MIRRHLQRGDVVLATIPFTDLQSSKVRPALVVSQGQIGQDVILVAISSVVRAEDSPSDLRLDAQHPDFAETGLMRTSVVRTHHIATVHDRVAIRVPGRLSLQWMSQVDQLLTQILGLSAD